MFSKKGNYSQMTDEALVLSAQKGDINAETTILERFKDSVKKTASVYHSKYPSYCALGLLDTDDLYQEGLLGLLSAIYSFRPEKNVSFKTYSSICIENALKSVLKATTAKKFVPPGIVLSIDDVDIPSYISPEESLIADGTFEELNCFLKTELSEKEFSVIRLFLAGYSYKTISEQLGISDKAVDNAMQRIRAKLSKFLESNRS